MTRLRRVTLVLASMAAAWQANCFVNEGQECVGNACSQDPGGAQAVSGNLLVSADGSMAVTALEIALEDGGREVSLVGVSLADGALVPGPVIASPQVPALLLTPDVHRAWLAREGDGLDTLAPLDLATMTEGAPLDLPAGRYRAPLAGPLGGWLSMIERGAAERAETALHLVRVADGAGFDLATGGLAYDVRLSRDEGRVVALVHPAEFLGGGTVEDQAKVSTYEVRAWTLGAEGPAGEPAAVRIENFEPNLVGFLGWSVRLAPSGRWAAVSGYEKVGEHVETDPETGAAETVDDLAPVTALIDLDEGRLHARLACDGPVAFTPDSATVVGHRPATDPDGQAASELVFVDVATLAETVAPVDYAFPVYYVTPAGDLVVTYGLFQTDGERRVLLTSLDTGETSEADAPGLTLTEFSVSADGRTMHVVDGGALYALGLYDGSVTALLPADQALDNLCPLPDGRTLLLTRDKTTELLWFDLHQGRVVRTVGLRG